MWTFEKPRPPPPLRPHQFEIILHAYCRYLCIYSWGKKDSTKRYLWSKTILTTGSVGGPGVDPPPRKMNTFFLRSLALSVPIYRHFQSNGDKWQSSKHRKIC